LRRIGKAKLAEGSLQVKSGLSGDLLEHLSVLEDVPADHQLLLIAGDTCGTKWFSASALFKS